MEKLIIDELTVWQPNESQYIKFRILDNSNKLCVYTYINQEELKQLIEFLTNQLEK